MSKSSTREDYKKAAGTQNSEGFGAGQTVSGNQLKQDTTQDMTMDLFTGLLSDSAEKTKKRISETKKDVTESKGKIESDQIVEATDQVAEPVKMAKRTKAEPMSSRRLGGQKDENAFRTISEVATEVGVQQHVLRFWETKFKQIKPLKRGGGRRYYRPQDVDLIKNIHHCLYNEGYTIKGVQRLLKLKKDLSTVGVAAPQTEATEVVTTKQPETQKNTQTKANKTQATKSDGIASSASKAEFEAEVKDVLKDLKSMQALLNSIGKGE